MKYLLLLFIVFCLVCCVGPGIPRIPAGPKHINTPHSHYTEAQAENAMFSFWSEVSSRTYRCYTMLGSKVYFVHSESGEKNFGGRCDFMPEVVVVKCHNSVGTNHLIRDKTIWWACSVHLQDDYIHNQVISEVDMKFLTDGIGSGKYGL